MCACMHCVCRHVRKSATAGGSYSAPHRSQAGITGSCETLDRDVGN